MAGSHDGTVILLSSAIRQTTDTDHHHDHNSKYYARSPTPADDHDGGSGIATTQSQVPTHLHPLDNLPYFSDRIKCCDPIKTSQLHVIISIGSCIIRCILFVDQLHHQAVDEGNSTTSLFESSSLHAIARAIPSYSCSSTLRRLI